MKCTLTADGYSEPKYVTNMADIKYKGEISGPLPYTIPQPRVG